MSKKVLLVNPRFADEVSIFNIPISLLYLGSWLVNNGYEVCILDALHFKDMPVLLQRIESELSSALCVGLSVMSSQIPNALQISKFVRHYDASIPIIWGGVHPTLYPEMVARHELVDFAVKGEGEVTLSELLEAIEQGNFQPDNIKGLAFKAGDDVTLTPDRELLDVNKVPPVNWELIADLKPGSSLREIADLTEHGLPLVTSRGCPYRCTFCINSVTGLKYRHCHTHLVLENLRTILALGVDRICFWDELFFADKKKVKEFLNSIEKEGLSFRWYASSRIDYFKADYLGSEDLLLRLKKAGCETIGMGAESGSQRVLDLLMKGATVEDTLNAAHLLHEAGIRANFSFMIGLPGEEEEDYKKTLQLIEKIREIDDSVVIFGPQIYRPYPGSQLYLQCLSQGFKEPSSLEEWASSPYIRLEISTSQYKKSLYPWIEYSGDLTNLVFYVSLSTVHLRWRPITKLIRLIGATRCRKFYFKYPIAKKIYGLLRGTRIENFLRQEEVI
ncbi:MAG: B12-binding domain-containing radical SAM protein [Dehalococcoidia bacterium]|nr:B12-binding domain-containing radical SAM protein [Dehalococcoidia bacterium]